MKLELKHLAGYLPYGLKGVEAIGSTIHILHSLDINKKAIWRNQEFLAMTSRIDCKPLLRPISDLTKEIEVNGEKFVPHLELGGRPNLKDYDFVYFKKNIENLSFGLIQQLLEWHFDIYGLIELGLAIEKTN